MKSSFDTLIITAGTVFTFWVIVTAGMKFEINIGGKPYGIKVGGLSRAEIEYLYRAQQLNSLPTDAIVFTESEVVNELGQQKFTEMFENFYYPRFTHFDGANLPGGITIFIFYRG